MLKATVFSKLVKTLEHEVNTEARKKKKVALHWLSVKIIAEFLLRMLMYQQLINRSLMHAIMNQQINQDVFGLTAIDGAGELSMFNQCGNPF